MWLLSIDSLIFLKASFALSTLAPISCNLVACVAYYSPHTGLKNGNEKKMFWLSLDCASGFVYKTLFVRKRLTKSKYQRMPS